MELIQGIQNLLAWGGDALGIVNDILGGITWDFLLWLFPPALAGLVSLSLDVLMVFVSIGLVKKLILILG